MSLEIGAVYLVRCRSFGVGIWTGKGFLGSRKKFGDQYLAQEYLIEKEGEPQHTWGTVWEFERIGKLKVPDLVVARIMENNQSLEYASIMALLEAMDEYVYRTRIEGGSE